MSSGDRSIRYPSCVFISYLSCKTITVKPYGTPWHLVLMAMLPDDHPCSWQAAMGVNWPKLQVVSFTPE